MPQGGLPSREARRAEAALVRRVRRGVHAGAVGRPLLLAGVPAGRVPEAQARSDVGVTGPLLTAREVADRLGLTPATVLRWARAGELPGFRLGRALRFREADLEAWLEAHATGAAPQGGVSQPGGRAQPGGYATLTSSQSANAPRHERATTKEVT
jgi:excisionase family DNA binding protein